MSVKPSTGKHDSWWAGLKKSLATPLRMLGSGKKETVPKKNVPNLGMFVFSHTGDVIAAQRALEEKGCAVTVKGPPPQLRTGCDMILEFPLLEELRYRMILETAKLVPLAVVPVHDTLLEPVSLYQIKDFGQWLMVRAANMKITVEKDSLRIVNISGGGCPDVPYLASLLVGKTLDEAPEPKEYGQTLCAFSLQLAFTEIVRLCRG